THDAAQGRAAQKPHGRCVGGQVRRLTTIGLTPRRPLERPSRAAFSWPCSGRQKWSEGGRRNEMAINLDYDIDLQLEAAATEAEIAATSEPELHQDDSLAGTPEDLSAAALYLREVARNPLLTPQEEIDFAQRNENGRAAREELMAADETLPLERRLE